MWEYSVLQVHQFWTIQILLYQIIKSIHGSVLWGKKFVETDEKKNNYVIHTRTRGFRGRHRCGATLLYGNLTCNERKTPIILVSAAHCNYICKNDQGHILEFCCCRDDKEQGSCKNVSHFISGVLILSYYI